MRRFIRYQLPVYVYAVAIFVISSVPRLSAPPLGIEIQDKVYHIIEYGLFGWLLYRAFSVSRWKHSYRLTLVVGGLWAVSDEIHQHFVLGRDASLLDVAADWFGIAISLVFFRLRRQKADEKFSSHQWKSGDGSRGVKEQSPVFDEIRDLVTERRNPNSLDLDMKSTDEVLRLINAEDKKVAEVVEGEIPFISQAVELIVDSLRGGGKLFYVGAGTSGRLGVLDAAECPPTFGTPPEMVQGIIAGGYRSLIRSREGAEDDFSGGANDLRKRGLCKRDVVVGITACRRTPYVLGALAEARGRGARTIFICSNPRSELSVKVDVAICLVVGPEVIMGSTRMKAGTAQKMVLNMLTTVAMVRLGKVYQNMMVDLRATSQKLLERAKRMVMIACDADYTTASDVLKRAGGNVKLAIVMLRTGLDCQRAAERLRLANGLVRMALVE